ncbi:ABC transporter permease subunit ['Fragaria x ananassa' phyllody phytoplasma]|uniref:ABC transporter permease subunit n=1 Tax='Fragaria x ananassa' phyllody phytoplasma TaxID=2358428 RepID=A0ABS5K3M0_9MOLU|nr:ABC transporter permease subunit ['Fragaria x ananassa' phyllody phytoplasma]MBS2126514.1 ABC transporter permease subunit ['Fragaria x ananassa' phyllody phytoplasma]
MPYFFTILGKILFYQESNKYLFWQALCETLKITFCSTLLSFLIGVALGIYLYLCKIQNHHKRYLIINTIINLLIAIPFILLIVLFIEFLWRPLLGNSWSYGFKVSLLSLTLILTPLFARHCEQIFMTINQELYQTSDSLGASKLQFIFFFVLKEARTDVILKVASLFVTSLAYSSVLGIIGHMGLGQLAISRGYLGELFVREIHGFNNLDLILIILLIMFILTQIVQLIAHFIALKLDKR